MRLDPFYLILDSAAWLGRLVPLGVKLVQLRIKDRPEAELRAEIRAAKASGLRGPEFRRLGEKRAQQVGRDVLDYHYADGTPLLPKEALKAAALDQGEFTERLGRELHESGERLGAFR